MGCLGDLVDSKEPWKWGRIFAYCGEWGELPALSSLGSGMLVLLQDTNQLCTGRGCPNQNARGASTEEHQRTPRWPGDSKRGRGWKGKLRLSYKDPVSLPTLEKNGKQLQYSCLENPMNSMKRQKDRTLKDELPRSVQFSRSVVGAQYATGDQWRNNSRKNEEMEPKQNNTQLWIWLVMEARSDAVKINIA